MARTIVAAEDNPDGAPIINRAPKLGTLQVGAPGDVAITQANTRCEVALKNTGGGPAATMPKGSPPPRRQTERST